MTARLAVVVAAWLVVTTGTPTPAAVGAERLDNHRATVDWPSRGFPTLQAAIDATPDGGTVRIGPGSHRIDEPVVVEGRRLTVTGSGSGNRHRRRVTDLRGPPPRPVVDGDGNVVLAADEVRGLFTLIGADVTISDMRISGHDAGIVAIDDGAGRTGALVVRDVTIGETGRGILATSHGPVQLEDVQVSATLWHGVGVCSAASVTVTTVQVTDASSVGMYFCDTDAFVFDSAAFDNEGGGIYLLRVGSGWVDGSTAAVNRLFGIGVVESSNPVLLTDNLVLATAAGGQGADVGGDGVAVVSATVTVRDSVILGNHRAGLVNYAGTVGLADCRVGCNGFDLNGEELSGVPFQFLDLGDNTCGCPATSACLTVSTGLAPPPPIDP